MKILQLNTWWGGKLNKNISALLATEQPDIVCLQEAVSFTGKDSGLFLTVEQIQEQGDYPYRVFSPAFSFNLMHAVAHFGNCILSRFPIKEENTIYTNLEHIENFDFDKHDYNVRNFIHAVISVNGKLCDVLTHHGYHVPEHKNGNPETMRQMKLLDNYIVNIKNPVILTGDFNLAPDSRSLEELNKNLKNLSVEYRLKTTRSQLTHKTEVCDYIFVNGKVEVKNFYAAEEIVSDHKALVLEFDI